jgi:hypothetical protein
MARADGSYAGSSASSPAPTSSSSTTGASRRRATPSALELIDRCVLSRVITVLAAARANQRNAKGLAWIEYWRTTGVHGDAKARARRGGQGRRSSSRIIDG